MNLIVIDDNKSFGASLKYALADREVICLEPKEALDKINGLNGTILINTHLKLKPTDRRREYKGLDLVCELLSKKFLYPIIALSLDKEERLNEKLQKEYDNLKLKDLDINYIKLPFSLKEFEGIALLAKTCATKREELSKKLDMAEFKKYIRNNFVHGPWGNIVRDLNGACSEIAKGNYRQAISLFNICESVCMRAKESILRAGKSFILTKENSDGVKEVEELLAKINKAIDEAVDYIEGNKPATDSIEKINVYKDKIDSLINAMALKGSSYA